MASMTPALRAQLIDAMEATFAGNAGRIDHAMTVLDFAEQILAVEDADEQVVVAAAILHDIGVVPAEVAKGTSDHHDQEVFGPPLAREILTGLNVDAAVMEAVCEIIAHHHNGRIDTPEFNILWDADWLVNFPGHYGEASPEDRSAAITRLFRTKAGAGIACEQFASA
jgi:hypothetical protein